MPLDSTTPDQKSAWRHHKGSFFAWIAASSITLLFCLSAWLPSLLPTSSGIDAFVPPFVSGQRDLDYQSLATEYLAVAESLYQGNGFSDPFGYPAGPTAWVAPLFPLILASLLWVTNNDLAATGTIVAILNAAVLAFVASDVVRQGWKASHAKLSLASVTIVMIGNYPELCQRMSDGWLLLAIMHFIVTRSRHLYAGVTSTRVYCWGILGGVAGLASPAVLFAWLGFTAYRWRSLGARSGITALLLCCTVVSPWILRNYFVFGRFIPIKSNAGFEIEQALLRDDDGVVDFTRSLGHPSSTPSEAILHAELGEQAYIRQRLERVSESLPATVPRWMVHCLNRLTAATVFQVPQTQSDEQLAWTHVSRPCFAFPMLCFLLSLWFPGRLERQQLEALLLLGLYLLPYVLISYYSRYIIPVTGIHMLLGYWGLERLYNASRYHFGRRTFTHGR